MYLKNIYLSHKNFWNKEHVLRVIVSVMFFVVALLVRGYADKYLGRVKGVAVGDLLLNWLRTIDVNFVIIQGALILSLLVIWLCLTRPQYLAFTLKVLALFVLIRSFFISLTHLGTVPEQLVFDTQAWGWSLYDTFFNARGDFFFSGHTGTPFIMALVFWRERRWRTVFLIISLVMGISVLLAHIHYSIDVFAAPFMAYGIFVVAKQWFAKDFDLTNRQLIE